MGKSIIAVLRVPFDALSDRVEGEAEDGFSRVRAPAGTDGTYEARSQGDATIVRVSDLPDDAPLGLVLHALLGEDVIARHADERGVFVSDTAGAGESYDELVAGDGEFVKPEKGGLTADAEDRIVSLLEKRSSREALAAKLAADFGDRDAGAVVDSESDEGGEEKTSDVARLHAALDRRFASSKMRGELDEDLRDTIEAPPDIDSDEDPPSQDETAS